MNNEHFPGLSPHPAQVSPAAGQHNGRVNFMGAEREIDKDILAVGIKRLDISPAIRLKLSDSAPSDQSKWFLFGGRDRKLPASKVYQHFGFQILDLAFWWHMKEGRVMDQELC